MHYFSNERLFFQRAVSLCPALPLLGSAHAVLGRGVSSLTEGQAFCPQKPTSRAQDPWGQRPWAQVSPRTPQGPTSPLSPICSPAPEKARPRGSLWPLGGLLAAVSTPSHLPPGHCVWSACRANLWKVRDDDKWSGSPRGRPHGRPFRTRGWRVEPLTLKPVPVEARVLQTSLQPCARVSQVCCPGSWTLGSPCPPQAGSPGDREP